MIVDKLLSTLDKVTPLGNGRWKACCPAHDDKHPSLAIREIDGDRVLIHCFSGCNVESVLSSVGLAFSDLYPEQISTGYRREKRPFSPMDILEIMLHEALVASICANQITMGDKTGETHNRISLAAMRLSRAVEVARGG